MKRFTFLSLIAAALVTALVASYPSSAAVTVNSAALRATSASLSTLLACEDQTLSQCWVSLGGTATNLTQATAHNIVKASAGEVVGFYVNTTTSGTVRFWDDATGNCDASAKGATITPAVGFHQYPGRFGTGICVLTGGTAIDFTLFWK